MMRLKENEIGMNTGVRPIHTSFIYYSNGGRQGLVVQ